MGHDFLFVHHRAHRGCQAIEHKGRGVSLVGFDGDRIGIDGPDPVAHIVGGEAELPQNEGRGFVQNDGALEGKGHVFSGQRVARRKRDPVADLKGIGLAVRRHRPAFRRDAIDFADILHVVADQAVVCVAGVFRPGELENFSGIQGDNVIELPRHDQSIGGGDCFDSDLWRFGPRRLPDGIACDDDNHSQNKCKPSLHGKPPVEKGFRNAGRRDYSRWPVLNGGTRTVEGYSIQRAVLFLSRAELCHAVVRKC